MTAKKNDKCQAECEGKCAARCGKSARPAKSAKPAKCERGLKETVEKVVEKVKTAVKKVPPFLARMQAELEKLLELIAKAEAALNTLEVFTRRDKESRRSKALLKKQVKAMKAYAEALKERIADETAKL